MLSTRSTQDISYAFERTTGFYHTHHAPQSTAAANISSWVQQQQYHTYMRWIDGYATTTCLYCL